MADKIKFIDPVVEENYEATGDKDVVIHIGKHHGKLSTISEATAKSLMDVKDPNIKKKILTSAVAAPKTDPAK